MEAVKSPTNFEAIECVLVIAELLKQSSQVIATDFLSSKVHNRLLRQGGIRVLGCGLLFLHLLLLLGALSGLCHSLD